MTDRSAAPVVLAVLLSSLGCGLLGPSEPHPFVTHGEEVGRWRTTARALHEEIASNYQPIDPDAPCEAPGRTLNTLTTAGDTELISLHMLDYPASQHTADIEFGPLASTLLNRAGWTGQRSEYEAQTLASIEAARRIEHLLVVRAGASAWGTDVVLVDFPSGVIRCRYRIEPVAELYDPLTGDLELDGRKAEQIAGLKDRFEAELQARFGVSTGRPAPPPPPAHVLLARERALRIAQQLDAATELPACDTEPPPGTPQATVRRLRAFAGLPPMTKDDPEFAWEAVGGTTPAWQDVVRRGLDDTQRKAAVDAVMSAPAYHVLDIEQTTPAQARPQDGGHVLTAPGALTARRVRFDPAGEPVCQDRVELVNRVPLDVTVLTAGNLLMDDSLQYASRRDLLAQLVARFPHTPP